VSAPYQGLGQTKNSCSKGKTAVGVLAAALVFGLIAFGMNQTRLGSIIPTYDIDEGIEDEMLGNPI
jgi:hypothetical protein